MSIDAVDVAAVIDDILAVGLTLASLATTVDPRTAARLNQASEDLDAVIRNLRAAISVTAQPIRQQHRPGLKTVGTRTARPGRTPSPGGTSHTWSRIEKGVVDEGCPSGERVDEQRRAG